MRASASVMECIDRMRKEGRIVEYGSPAPTPVPLVDSISQKDFQEAVIREAERRNWLVFHPYSSRRSKEGYPDLTLARGNRVLCIELKTETGELSADQRSWLEVLSGVGGNVEYHCFRPSDWQTIVRLLE